MGGCSRVLRYHPATDRAQAVHHRVRDQMTRTMQCRDGGAFEASGQGPGADGR